jgi:hypothetical protein
MTEETDEKVIILRDVCIAVSEPHHPPEYAKLYGKVFGHPNYEDGEGIFPSVPIAFDEESRVFTGYSGRQYKLESIDPGYEKEFPNALDRICDRIKQQVVNQNTV